jgi:hypothetical protein
MILVDSYLPLLELWIVCLALVRLRPVVPFLAEGSNCILINECFFYVALVTGITCLSGLTEAPSNIHTSNKRQTARYSCNNQVLMSKGSQLNPMCTTFMFRRKCLLLSHQGRQLALPYRIYFEFLSRMSELGPTPSDLRLHSLAFCFEFAFTFAFCPSHLSLAGR